MPSLGNWNRNDSVSTRPTALRSSALAEFQSRLQAAQQGEQSRADRFQAWQHRWIDAKGQLIQRLDAFDEHLARLTDDKRLSPKLTIVGSDFFDET